MIAVICLALTRSLASVNRLKNTDTLKQGNVVGIDPRIRLIITAQLLYTPIVCLDET